MTTSTVVWTKEEAFAWEKEVLEINCKNREEIQAKFPPTIIYEDLYQISTLESIRSAARLNRGDLIYLLFEFGQAGIYNNYPFNEPDEPWLAEVVAGKHWTDECQALFGEIWDGDLETLYETANDAMDRLNILL